MFNNGINPEQAGGILMAQVLAKSSRGKFINVRRTIRDLEDIEDFSSRGGDRTSASDLLKMLQGPQAVAPAPAPDEVNTCPSVPKLPTSPEPLMLKRLPIIPLINFLL